MPAERVLRGRGLRELFRRRLVRDLGPRGPRVPPVVSRNPAVRAAPVSPTPLWPDGWSVVSEDAELTAWNTAQDTTGCGWSRTCCGTPGSPSWSGANPSGLSPAPSLHRADDAVELSNTWTRGDEADEIHSMLRCAEVLYPDAPVVGYSRNETLARLHRRRLQHPRPPGGVGSGAVTFTGPYGGDVHGQSKVTKPGHALSRFTIPIPEAGRTFTFGCGGTVLSVHGRKRSGVLGRPAAPAANRQTTRPNESSRHAHTQQVHHDDRAHRGRAHGRSHLRLGSHHRRRRARGSSARARSSPRSAGTTPPHRRTRAVSRSAPSRRPSSRSRRTCRRPAPRRARRSAPCP